MADMRPITIKLYDRLDRLVDEMSFPPRGPGEEPRVFIWCGKRFREDDSGWHTGPSAVEIEDAA